MYRLARRPNKYTGRKGRRNDSLACCHGVVGWGGCTVGREGERRVGGRVGDVTHVSMLMLLQWPFKGETMGIQGCSATQPEIRKMEGNIMRRSQLNTVMQEQRGGTGGGKRVGKKGGREGGTVRGRSYSCLHVKSSLAHAHYIRMSAYGWSFPVTSPGTRSGWRAPLNVGLCACSGMQW